MITKGQERCLYVFPTAEFARLTEQLRGAPLTAKAARDYSRVFFASAPTRCRTSRAGSRSRRPLREYAGLNRDCVVIGANTRVEIWDAAAWRGYLADQRAGLRRPVGGGAARSLLTATAVVR